MAKESDRGHPACALQKTDRAQKYCRRGLGLSVQPASELFLRNVQMTRERLEAAGDIQGL